VSIFFQLSSMKVMSTMNRVMLIQHPQAFTSDYRNQRFFNNDNLSQAQ